jgi:hypothetical protein
VAFDKIANEIEGGKWLQLQEAEFSKISRGLLGLGYSASTCIQNLNWDLSTVSSIS